MSRGRRFRARSRVVALGAVLALPMTLLLGTSAQAHSGGPPNEANVICTGNDNYVKSCFEQDGDDFWVYDAEADGASAVVRWRTSYGREGSCRNSHSAGNWHECKYDMAEGDPPGRTKVYWEHWTYDADHSDWDYISGTYSARISSVWIEPV